MCHRDEYSKKTYLIDFIDCFFEGRRNSALTKAPKVTRKGTVATNCRTLAVPVGSKGFVGLIRNRKKAGFKTPDGYRCEDFGLNEERLKIPK